MRFPVVGIVLTALVLMGGPAVAGPRKSATLTVSFDGSCRAVSTVTWTGYPVDHIRHVFYRDTVFDWFNTTSSPTGTSGTAVSTDPNFAHGSEAWQVHVILRTVGGGRLAELDGAAAAPTACP
jgi:hypothetical protein